MHHPHSDGQTLVLATDFAGFSEDRLNVVKPKLVSREAETLSSIRHNSVAGRLASPSQRRAWIPQLGTEGFFMLITTLPEI
ncbi:MAG: hypothetical protein CL862_05090 [Cyanobium sp. NAT70]|nr:hypothetical protein [Cyanobium sp. NAT70]